MPKGSFAVDVPHFCGQMIHVKVDWDETYQTRHEPGDYEEYHAYFCEGYDYDLAKCPKCGVNLFDDSLFQENIKVAADMVADRGEHYPGDDIEDVDDGDYIADRVRDEVDYSHPILDEPLDIEIGFDDLFTIPEDDERI